MSALYTLCLAGLLAWPFAAAVLDAGTVSSAERFFFERQETGLLALLVAGFAAWRRRRALPEATAIAGDPVRRIGSLLLGACGLSLLVWSRLVVAEDLHLFALVLLMAAVLVHLRGWRAIRAWLLPFAVAFLVLPLPAPLYNELVWGAQRLATALAATLLEILGQPISSGSMMISLGAHDFWVIETCSGLRSAELLTLMSLLIIEIAPGRSVWNGLIVLLAPPLALLLNALRIVAVVLFDAEQANASDHVAQGLVAVLIGTIVLFGLQRLVCRVTGEGEILRDLPSRPGFPVRRELRFIGGWALVAGLVGVLVPSSATTPERARSTSSFSFPVEGSGWSSAPLASSGMFFNTLPIGRSIHRRYALSSDPGRRPVTVDFYFARKRTSSTRLSLTSSKFGWLGPGFESVDRGAARVWQVGGEGRWYESRRGDERFMVLVWQAGEPGLVEESVLCLLALGRRPDASRGQHVFRLAAPIGGGRTEARAEERARKAIYRFLEDFESELGRLSAVR